ncbi:MAG: ATP-binding cassette domain-containing protein, partial [Saprospiraceae bacterium]
MIPYLKIENAVFAHAQKSFFKGFNWTINQGENWIITGKIGAGKTSLVQALAGKYYLTQGQLTYPYLSATLPTIKSTYELKRKCIKVVSFKDDSRAFDPHSFFYSQRFNSFAADGTITVWEYLMEAGYSEYKKEHVDLIKRTGVFDLLDLERIKLSSGQSRKLLITTAILQQPKLLIIDNPYMGLDASSRQEFNELLDDLVKNEDIQLILAGQYDVLPSCISHELELDNFTPIYNGVIRQKERIEETSTIKVPYGKHFSLLSPQELMAAKKDLLTKFRSEIIEKVKLIYNKPNNFTNWKIIFSLKDAVVAYYGKKVLDDINWVVKPGEKWALFGANGSGKSTLLALLFGDHPQAYANELYLFDKKRGVGQNIWDIKKRTGFTSSELHFFFNAKLT